jgi:hypothetical protein
MQYRKLSAQTFANNARTNSTAPVHSELSIPGATGRPTHLQHGTFEIADGNPVHGEAAANCHLRQPLTQIGANDS